LCFYFFPCYAIFNGTCIDFLKERDPFLPAFHWSPGLKKGVSPYALPGIGKRIHVPWRSSCFSKEVPLGFCVKVSHRSPFPNSASAWISCAGYVHFPSPSQLFQLKVRFTCLSCPCWRAGLVFDSRRPSYRCGPCAFPPMYRHDVFPLLRPAGDILVPELRPLSLDGSRASLTDLRFWLICDLTVLLYLPLA